MIFDHDELTDKAEGLVVRHHFDGGYGIAIFISQREHGFGCHDVKVFDTVEGHATGQLALFSFETFDNASEFVRVLTTTQAFSVLVTDYGRSEGPCL